MTAWLINWAVVQQTIVVLLGAFIIFYYAYVVNLYFDKSIPPKLTKQRFLLGLIPFFLWIALLIEEYIQLD